MAIVMMCDKDDEGAELNEYWTNNVRSYRPEASPIYTRVTHKGLVLYVGERNYYHDSDFYALVWNEEKQDVDTVEWGSTRGWTYPNNAVVDATEDVVKKYDALKARLEKERRERIEKERQARLERESEECGISVEELVEMESIIRMRKKSPPQNDFPKPGIMIASVPTSANLSPNRFGSG